MMINTQLHLKSSFEVHNEPLCLWYEVPRGTANYKSCKAQHTVQERFEAPIKVMNDKDPRLASPRSVLLKFNKNSLQRIHTNSWVAGDEDGDAKPGISNV